MPTDDEFRRVAEDVRALARSLARDVRGAVERAREDTSHRDLSGIRAAERVGRDELRRARAAVRQYAPRRSHHHHDRAPGPWWPDRPAGSSGPRWDSWARRRAPGAPGIESTGQDRDPSRWPVRAARRPRAAPLPALRHRHDGTTLLGLLAVVFGLAWLAAGTHVLQVSAEGVLAVAIMVLGGAMVVTARTDWALSRRSWPLMTGAALVVALVVSSSSPSLGDGFRHLQIGSTTVAPTSWTDLPAHLRGGIGRTEVNLVGIADPPPSGRSLTIDGAVGALVIELPRGLTVDLDGRIGLGQVTVDGVNLASGFRQRFGRRLGPTGGTEPVFALHVNSGVGSVLVTEHVGP